MHSFLPLNKEASENIRKIERETNTHIFKHQSDVYSFKAKILRCRLWRWWNEKAFLSQEIQTTTKKSTDVRNFNVWCWTYRPTLSKSANLSINVGNLSHYKMKQKICSKSITILPKPQHKKQWFPRHTEARNQKNSYGVPQKTPTPPLPLPPSHSPES